MSPRPAISREQFRESTSVAPASSAASRAGSGSAGSGWVLVARLIRPHGRRGELVAEILTDFPERFHERRLLYLIPPERVGTRPREMQLDSFWFLRSRIVMKFQGIDSINEAEGLRGYAVAIRAAERVPLEAGSFYVSDLMGCRVIDLNQGGSEVGEIAGIDRDTSSTELLVVRPPGIRGSGNELLIPFVKEYVIRIDAANRRVEMRLPEGLLEINAPITEDEKRETSGK